MYWVGVDIGSLTTKLAALDDAGRVAVSDIAASGRSGVKVGEAMLAALPREQVRAVVATGYGRVTFVRADLEVSEITCHARGVLACFEDVRTVVDVGGQDSKAIRMDAAGRVQQFAMNDRCAAGTGRFLDVMSHALEVPVEEFAALAGAARNAVTMSSTCTVFAESEVIGYLNAGLRAEDIAAGLSEAIASRIAGLAGQVGVAPRVVMTGGVAWNHAVVEALARHLGCDVSVPENPQMTGALGAAILAREKFP
jgi:predicted CoA-substrate-specific enzyme activase